jgi:hypothetical protein
VVNDREAAEDEGVVQLVHSFMAKYRDEELGKELMKIYEHSNYKDGSEQSSKTKRKTYNHPPTSRD